MTKQYSIARARDNLARVVHEAERGDRIELTRRGKPVAVVLSATDYGRLTRKSPSFLQALHKFRERSKLEELDIDPDEIWGGLRDRSPGREVVF